MNYKQVGKGQPAAPLDIFPKESLEGVVRVAIRDLRHDSGELLEGEILVTDMTDASEEVRLMYARALITERGGMLCHAAVFSNSIGLPCVVGAENLSDKLKTGDYVRIDYDGSIYLRDESSER